uniref:Putative secreted protein n=1 Tax=Anopheles marajoara TaxID=58244 RepID=A0A2M4CE31_9DIPT
MERCSPYPLSLCVSLHLFHLAGCCSLSDRVPLNRSRYFTLALSVIGKAIGARHCDMSQDYRSVVSRCSIC